MAKQPPLPEGVGVDVWPQQTRDWWRHLGEDPAYATLTDLDWDFALETAPIHALYWDGRTDLAGELRARRQILASRAEGKHGGY